VAITTVVYNKFKLNGVLPNVLDGHALKLCLLTSAYTPDYDTHEFYSDLTNELAASGNYATGGAALSGLASGIDTTGDFAYLDGNDVTWTALTPSAAFRYAALYDTTDSNRLIMLINFGVDQDPNGQDFAVTWPAAASGGILKAV
jgi:hypothetical protein